MVTRWKLRGTVAEPLTYSLRTVHRSPCTCRVPRASPYSCTNLAAIDFYLVHPFLHLHTAASASSSTDPKVAKPALAATAIGESRCRTTTAMLKRPRTEAHTRSDEAQVSSIHPTRLPCEPAGQCACWDIVHKAVSLCAHSVASPPPPPLSTPWSKPARIDVKSALLTWSELIALQVLWLLLLMRKPVNHN